MGNQSFTVAREDVKEVSASRVGKLAVSGRYHESPRLFQHDYELEEKVLGTGVSGKVLVAKNLQSGVQVAVKRLSLRSLSARAKNDLRNEVEIYLALDHPQITRLLDVYEVEHELILVMECMEGGELFDRVIEREHFSEKDAADTAERMVLPLNYLHSQNIAHCDVKLENYLYQKKGCEVLKLCDFGFSKIRRPNTKMKVSCGTLAYVAPEVLGGSYDCAVDLWSFGVCVFILMAGYMPFDGSDSQQVSLIKSGIWDFDDPVWVNVSETAKNFIRKLLVVDPSKRMTAAEALKHPWLASREHATDVAVDRGILSAMKSFARASKFRRACMEMVAWSLTFEERAQVRAAFEELDVAREGTITLAAFKQVLESRFDLSDEDVAAVFDALDVCHDHRIHYSEFLAAMVSSRISLHDGLLRSTFRRFDPNHTGFITRESLEQVLGKTFEGAEADELLKEVDSTGSGKVSAEEFMQYLQGDEASHAHSSAADRVIDAALRCTDMKSAVQAIASAEAKQCPVRRRVNEHLEQAERRVRRKLSIEPASAAAADSADAKAAAAELPSPAATPTASGAEAGTAGG